MSIIGITMGCPAGIGPEIILRYFADRSWPQIIQPVVIGDIGILQKCAEQLSLPAYFHEWTPDQPVPAEGIPVFKVSALPLHEHSWGHPSLASAKSMADYIKTAVDLILDGKIDGMTTCPISKTSLQQAGYTYPGHTEMLVDLTRADKYTMMMAGDTLKVTLMTIHCSLASVPSRLTTAGIIDLIEITHSSLRIDFGIASPRIAVAGLNPHSGEDGLFGLEEQDIILPAVEQAKTRSIDVQGPFPPDTVFFKAAAGHFDAVICMYHDQGLIPFKLLHFKDGVNVTLGLPIIRTSVDHGTAYDIAGKGLADATSLAAAVSMAASIHNNRKQYSASITPL
jgi:4-hydroxythreonine-4-phosphate dehydrogenase